MKTLFLSLTTILMTAASFGSGFVLPVYTELPLGTVKPGGWLLHQLQIMRDGTTGHLDEVYEKVKNSNGWLGGTGDGWEETPYWLDGAVPLAWLLDDKTLQEKVLKYINWTLDHQRPSGYFGPITKTEREKSNFVEIASCDQGEDWWPKMLRCCRQWTGSPSIRPQRGEYPGRFGQRESYYKGSYRVSL